MRCVLDTNVLISAALLPDSQPRRALRHVLGQGVVLLSHATLTELHTVLMRAKFDRYVDVNLREEFLSALVARSQWIEVVTGVKVCRDPSDDKFLAIALDGKADFLITGDADLLVLHPFAGISIVQPGEFLERVGAA